MVAFQKAVVKAKLGAWFWTDVDGGEQMNIPDENLTAVKGPLSKVYAFKGPEWVVALKERIAAAKKAKAAAASAAASSAAPAPGPESAAGAPASAELAPEAEHAFLVGDIVILGRPEKVGRLFQDLEAKIDKITAKMIQVTILSHKQAGKIKNFKPNQMSLKLSGVRRHTAGP